MSQDILNEINSLIKKYFDNQKEEEFIPGKTKIPLAVPQFGSDEVIEAVESLISTYLKNQSLDGEGKIVTYTIMTVPPEGFEQYSPYAWAVMEINNSDIRISGFLPNIAKPEDLPVGTTAKIVGYDARGIVLEKL